MADGLQGMFQSPQEIGPFHPTEILASQVGLLFCGGTFREAGTYEDGQALKVDSAGYLVKVAQDKPEEAECFLQTGFIMAENQKPRVMNVIWGGVLKLEVLKKASTWNDAMVDTVGGRIIRFGGGSPESATTGVGYALKF